MTEDNEYKDNRICRLDCRLLQGREQKISSAAIGRTDAEGRRRPYLNGGPPPSFPLPPSPLQGLTAAAPFSHVPCPPARSLKRRCILCSADLMAAADDGEGGAILASKEALGLIPYLRTYLLRLS